MGMIRDTLRTVIGARETETVKDALIEKRFSYQRDSIKRNMGQNN